MNGRDALADIESLNEPFGPFRVRSSSSASGSAILLIFEFSIVLFSSATIFEMTIPSKAMMFLLISCKYSKLLNIYNHEYLYYNIFDKNLKELYNKLIYAYAKGKIMIKSMTGFGRYEYADASRKITVEVKSVNHRYLDVNIKMPKKLNFFESAIRTLLKEYIERGKVDIYITYEDFTENNLSLQYNKALAGEYLKYLNQMAEEFGLENDIRVSTLSRYPEVFAMEEQPVDEDELWSSLEKALRGAFEPFVESRVREGENLKKDLCEKLDNMVKTADSGRVGREIFTFRVFYAAAKAGWTHTPRKPRYFPSMCLEKVRPYFPAFFSRNWLNFFCGTGDSRLSSHHLV